MTKWNKQELWSQNLILPLLALLTLSKIFNSSLYSSVKRDGGGAGWGGGGGGEAVAPQRAESVLQ